MKKTIIFTGGGTGGHVFPGLAVIEELRTRWEGEILWIGSKGGGEHRFVEQAGVRFQGIPCGKLRRYFSLKNFVDIFKVIAGIAASMRIIAREKPVLLFSKGGFVSVPPTIAAGRKRIPVITHESDTDPGLATKINTRYATRILLSFEETVKYFPEGKKDKIQVLGNPVRGSMLEGNGEIGRKMLGVPSGRKLILILGGSQGAQQVNEIVKSVKEELLSRYFIVHQMGPDLYEESGSSMYRTFPFIGDELPHYLAAADLVVSRAGANTLSEIAALGKPSILIPLRSGAGRGDQVKNAGLFSRTGAAEVLEGENARGDLLLEKVKKILEDEELRRKMGLAAEKLANRAAARQIAELILSMAGEL